MRSVWETPRRACLASPGPISSSDNCTPTELQGTRTESKRWQGPGYLPIDGGLYFPPLDSGWLWDWLHAWSPGQVVFWDLEARSRETLCFSPGLVEPRRHEEAGDDPEKAPV